MSETVASRTRDRAHGRDIVVIHDSCEIAVGGAKAAKRGFGPVGGGGATRGILVHAAIALDGKDGGLLGLAEVQTWNRSGGAKRKDRRRPLAEKESKRWLEVCRTAAERFAAAASITVIADAESDIYEVFTGLPSNIGLITRSARDRRLKAGGMLEPTIAGLPAQAVIIRIIPAAPGRKQRQARLELRFARVEIAAPQGLPKHCPKSLQLSALEAREIDAPQGVEPIRWLLLSTHELGDAAGATRIVDMYRGRWWIEQLFRTIKSAGIDIEEADIAEPRALLTLAGLATIAAVSVMQLVKARDGQTGMSLDDCFEEDDKPLIHALSRKLEGKTQKQKNPHPPDDLAFASWVMARLGGWTGYYGKPGPATINHGLTRYHAIKLGAQIAKDM